MNIFHKSLLVATGVVLGGVAVSSSFASFGRQNPEMNAAIEANDYSLLTAEMQEKISEEKFDKISTKHALHDAVKTAIEAQDYSLVPEEAQERITQEKFEEIITNQAQKSAVRDAIEANDYQAFVEVADEKALERISSEADFDAAVAKNQERAANKEALETTIQNNDFASFQKLVEQHQANKEAARPDDAPERDEPTTEQQQEKFDSLVEYYNTNGELPAMNKGKHQGRGKKMKGKNESNRKGFGGGMRR